MPVPFCPFVPFCPLDKIKSINFNRDLSAEERALVAKKNQGIFAFRIAQVPLKLIINILNDGGYRTSSPRTPADGCAAAFFVFSNTTRLAAVLGAMEEEAGKAHYELTVRLSQKGVVDRLKKLFAISRSEPDENQQEVTLDAIATRLTNGLRSVADVSDVVESERYPYKHASKIQHPRRI